LLCQNFDFFLIACSSFSFFESELDLILTSKLVLDVLAGAEAGEPAAFHHDAHLGRESFSFIHGVSREDDTSVLLAMGDARDHLPHESASSGVHAGGGLVQQDYLRVA
jgi:hypothetical protein